MSPTAQSELENFAQSWTQVLKYVVRQRSQVPSPLPEYEWDTENGEKGLDAIMLFVYDDDNLHTKVKECTDALTQLKRRLHQSKLMPVNVLPLTPAVMILSGVDEQSTRGGALLPENEPAIDQCEYVIGKCSDNSVLSKLASAMSISNASSTDSLKLAVTLGTVGGICADGVGCR